MARTESESCFCSLSLPPVQLLDDHLRGRINDLLRTELSPRHVPDRIEIVPAVPRTLSGKKLEVPVKRILEGAPTDQAVSRDSASRPGNAGSLRSARSRSFQTRVSSRSTCHRSQEGTRGYSTRILTCPLALSLRPAGSSPSIVSFPVL